MAKLSPSNIRIICSSCGSSNITRTTEHKEFYCKKCGTVLEELALG